MSDRQEIETLRGQVEEWAGTLSMRPLRPDEAEQAVNAMMALASATYTLAASLAESEAREQTLREALIPARDLTVAVMDKNIGELSDRARALLGGLNAACGDIPTIEEVQAIFAAAALAAVPSPAADGEGAEA